MAGRIPAARCRASLQSTPAHSQPTLVLKDAEHQAELYDSLQHMPVYAISRASPGRFISFNISDDILPTDVHMAMFIPALEHQTSDEQRAAWLPLAKSFRILGAYVQTELGHGSNVQALETTATFDPAADAFVVDTPSVSATKWWPGGLGKTATHCVLHARLVLPGGKDMGVHAFFVPLRDMETHEPLPGVRGRLLLPASCHHPAAAA